MVYIGREWAARGSFRFRSIRAEGERTFDFINLALWRTICAPFCNTGRAYIYIYVYRVHECYIQSAASGWGSSGIDFFFRFFFRFPLCDCIPYEISFFFLIFFVPRFSFDCLYLFVCSRFSYLERCWFDIHVSQEGQATDRGEAGRRPHRKVNWVTIFLFLMISDVVNIICVCRKLIVVFVTNVCTCIFH